MFNKLLLAVLLCGLTVTIIGVDLDTILEQHQESLRNLWHMRNKRSVNSRATDDECFEWYYEESDDCMQTYRSDTAKCSYTADAAKESLSAQGADTRTDLVGRGNGSCADMAECENYNDLLSFYGCYTNASRDGRDELYKVSSDSNAAYNSLKVQYANIDADKSKCNTNVGEIYVKSLADANKQFNDCRSGGGVPTKPTTTISSTDSTTTDSTTTDSTTTDSTTTDSTTTDSTTTDSTTTDSTTTDSTKTDSEISYKKINSPPEFSEEYMGKLAPLKNMWSVIRLAGY